MAALDALRSAWPSPIGGASSTCCSHVNSPSAISCTRSSVSQPAVSKHLPVLRDAGLVDARADASAPPLPGARRAAAARSTNGSRRTARCGPQQPRRPRTPSRHDARLSEEPMETEGTLEQIGDQWRVALHAHAAASAREGVACAHGTEHLAGWFPTDDRRRSSSRVRRCSSSSATTKARHSRARWSRRPAARARVLLGRGHVALRARTRRQGNRAHPHRHVRRARQGRTRRGRVARTASNRLRSRARRHGPATGDAQLEAAQRRCTSSASGRRRRRSARPRATPKRVSERL